MAEAIYPGEYPNRPLRSFINDPSLDKYAGQAEFLLNQLPDLFVPRVQYKRPGVANTCWYVALKEKPDIWIANFTIIKSNLNIEFRLARFFSVQDRHIKELGMKHQNNLPYFKLNEIGVDEAVNLLVVYIQAIKPYVLDGTHKTPGHSSVEYFIKQDLKALYPKERVRHGERPIRSPSGSYLELDLQIPDLKLAIEVQGPMHYSDCDIYGNYEEVKKRDDYKKQWCEKHGIKLMHIEWDGYMRTLFRLSETLRCQRFGVLVNAFIESTEPFVELKKKDFLT